MEKILKRAARGVALFMFFAASLAPGLTAQEPGLQSLEIHTQKGSHKFAVEIADTPETQTKGLMFRRSLPDNQGMLFLYGVPQEITMWMRNTYISLDMIFITKAGRVHRIARDTEPFSEDYIHSGGDVVAVLEIIGGGAAKLGIEVGDRVIHPYFKGK